MNKQGKKYGNERVPAEIATVPTVHDSSTVMSLLPCANGTLLYHTFHHIAGGQLSHALQYYYARRMPDHH